MRSTGHDTPVGRQSRAGAFVTAAGVAAVTPAVYSSLRRGLEGWLRRAYGAGLDERAVAALFAMVDHGVRAEEVA